MRTAELVQRYATRRDAEAFAQLVAEYKSMVLATCRRRLRSQADVDDAVQETFLRLARSAGSLRVNVAAWLHRCAVNVSIDLNRRAEARARHESAAAGPPFETSEAQRELAALREQIDTALAAIDEPSRELILQRYFVGRSQVDLAAEANVSPSALSQRLDRAIHALRTQLQGTTAPAVLMLGSSDQLVTLLEAEHASAIVSSELTASLNAIGVAGVGVGKLIGVMSAAVLLLLLTLAIGVWLVGKPGTGPTASTTPSSQPHSGVGMVAAAGSGPNWQAPADPADAALFGRVTNEAGEPIANATIDLNGGPSTTTDADGRYRIQSVRGEATYLTRVSADGYVPIRPFGNDLDVAVQLTPTGRVQRDWVLQQAVIVKVQVVDAGGEPLEAIRVECAPAVAEESWRVRAAAEDVDVDAQGNGMLFLPPSGKQYVLMATAKGRAPAMLRFTPKSIDEPLDLTVDLDAGITVEGIALCNDGKPATGWSISARLAGWDDSSLPIPDAPIDENGRFSIAHATRGSHDLTIMIPAGEGMSTGRPLGRFDFAEGKPLQVAVPMKSPGSLASISGTIQWVGSPQDRSVAYGVFIDAQRLDSNRDSYSTSIRGNPPEQDFTLHNVEPGDYRITVSGSTFGQVALDRVTIPGKLPPIKITVAGKPTLTATITDTVTGKPTTNFAYRLRKLQTLGDGPNYVGSTDWVQVNDPDGKLTVDLVGPGEYQIQVSAPNRAWVWSAPFRAETQGARVNVNVALAAGGSLRGVVTDAAGKPLAGAKVIPLSYAQSAVTEYGDAPRFDGDAGSVLTNDAGVFELHRLPAGTETLKIVHPDHAPRQVANIQVGDDTTREVPAIQLMPGGRVEGVVYNHAGSVVANAAVYFRDRYAYNGDENAGTIAIATTDNEGRFAVDHLAVQTLWVSLGEDGWRTPGTLRRVVRPQEGRTTTLRFGGTTTVTGRLVAGAAAKGNAKLALSSGDRYFGAFIAQCTTDAEGRFTFRGTPPGRYILYTDGQVDRIPLREVKIFDESIDLGDIADDRGRVVISFDADDPDDLHAVNSVSLTTDPRVAVWSPDIARFQREGDQWVCDEVPSGRYIVSAYLKSRRLGGQVDIERKAGQGEMSMRLRLPARSATLHYTPATQPSTFYAQLNDADGTTWATIAGDKPHDISLPVGTFHFVDWLSASELPLPPITVRKGESLAFTPPLEPPTRRVPINLWLWTADGTHITDASPTLVDAGGVIQPLRAFRGYDYVPYALLPGRYTLKMQRPCGSVFEQSFDVAATEKEFSPERAVDIVIR